MAPLSENDRIAAWAGYVQGLATEGMDVSGAVTDHIRAAVDAADDWADANDAAFNAALPEPFKSWATTRQKALLLRYVIERRYFTSSS